MLRLGKNKGFTLVELVVAVAIFATFALMVIFSVNAVTQINKARDSQRKQDIIQIRNALDTYYNDFGCYPQSIPFGEEWSSGEVVYMKKVPQDPDCSKTGYCYFYQTDLGLTCPQWDVLYAHLVRPTNAAASCQMLKLCTYMQKEYNFCLFSGDVSCEYINQNPLPTHAVPTPRPTSTPAPTAVPTIGPTPTPFICPPGSDPNAPFACTGLGVCNSFKSQEGNCIGGNPGGSTPCFCERTCGGNYCR